MNSQALKTEIDIDPEGLGYAQYKIEAPGRIADMLNALTFTAPRSRWISELGIMELYMDDPEAADALLTKLEAFADTQARFSSIVRRVLRFLKGNGFDIGSRSSQKMLTVLAQVGVLSVEESTNLKALANKPASRAEVLFGNGTIITELQVREALNVNV